MHCLIFGDVKTLTNLVVLMISEAEKGKVKLTEAEICQATLSGRSGELSSHVAQPRLSVSQSVQATEP